MSRDIPLFTAQEQAWYGLAPVPEIKIKCANEDCDTWMEAKYVDEARCDAEGCRKPFCDEHLVYREGLIFCGPDAIAHDAEQAKNAAEWGPNWRTDLRAGTSPILPVGKGWCAA
jgi:hypothetical protein